ncbi:MAG: S8 family serine peptidase, partial [Candidatus Limnocylindria bacterium]|nr:S8 family serine peptidase [Candidatus Limnocylindria bacterium]
MGSVKGFLAAAIAVAMLASSFDTAWTARASSFRANVDPSLSAGEVALVHTTAGRAGALSLKLAELGAVSIETEGAADTVIARLSNQALAWVATDPSVTVATRDIAVVAMGGGKGQSGFESGDKNGNDRQEKGSTTTTTFSTGLLAIRGPQAWTTTTGEGVTVAIMDTGIAQHPDLPKGKVRARVDFVHDSNPRNDPGGHGTFIAGLVAANGELKGVAP